MGKEFAKVTLVIIPTAAADEEGPGYESWRKPGIHGLGNMAPVGEGGLLEMLIPGPQTERL